MFAVVPVVVFESTTFEPGNDSFVLESRITPVIVPFANELKLMAIKSTMKENSTCGFFIKICIY
jgi:hypothetical protein